MLHNARCSTEFDFSPFCGGRSVAAARAAAARWHEDNYWGILCIRLAQCRKLPCCVGKHLWVEVAHEGLPGLALAACPWALGRAPSVPGGGRRVRSLSPKDRANVTSATLHQWPIPASYHPNPRIFYWDIVGGNGWYGYHGVHECYIESLAGTHPSSSS